MKLLSRLCVCATIAAAGIGCCRPYGGGQYGNGYPQYNQNCPGGNCGIGAGYAPQAAAYQPYGMQSTVPTTGAPPVAIAPAPVYYNPYPATALNYTPSY